MFKVNFRVPENLLIFGKSGDSGRLNNDGVVGHRDPLVEREVIKLLGAIHTSAKRETANAHHLHIANRIHLTLHT